MFTVLALRPAYGTRIHWLQRKACGLLQIVATAIIELGRADIKMTFGFPNVLQLRPVLRRRRARLRMKWATFWRSALQVQSRFWLANHASFHVNAGEGIERLPALRPI
jgi:hypothetical protein